MSKISELSDGGSLQPTDFLIAVRSGANVKVQADQTEFDRIRLGDNEKIELGNNQDLQIYHDGTNSYISDQGTNDLKVLATDFQLKNSADNEFMMTAVTDGAVTLYHNGSARLASSATGIDITGTVQATGYLAVEGTSGNTGAAGDRWIGGDGTAGTWFYNVPTGSNHYFGVNNTNKLVVNTSGIDVTGTATVDGILNSLASEFYASHGALVTTGSTAKVYATGSSFDGVNGSLVLQSRPTAGADVYVAAGATPKVVAKFLDGGDVHFFEDLGVTPKFVWDASSESLGIGTSSPDSPLEIQAATNSSSDTTYLKLYNAGENVGNIDFENGNGSLARITGTKEGAGASANDGILTFSTAFDSSLAERMRINSSGNVGIGGNGTGNGLGVYLSKGTGANFFEASDGTKTMITGSDSSQDFVKIGSLSAHPVGFVVGNGEKMRIDSSGNLLVRQTSAAVSDTHDGGTVEQFWGNQFSSSNSSNTKVMIGTGSTEGYVGASRLSSSGKYVVNSYLRFDNTNATAGSDAGQILFFTQSGGTNAAERMRIDSSGNVTVRTDTAGSPTRLIVSNGGTVQSGTAARLSFYEGATEASYIERRRDGSGITAFVTPADDNDIVFESAGSIGEFARFDSGNLLVGTTDSVIWNEAATDTSKEGVVIEPKSIQISRFEDTPLLINRQGNEGTLQVFAQDGTIIGSLGAYNSANYIQSGSAGSYTGLYFNTDKIEPVGNASGDIRADATVSLGSTASRFSDLFLSGTSSANQYRLKNGTTTTGGLFHEKDLVGSGSSYDTSLFAETGNALHFMVNGSATPVGTFDTDGRLLVSNSIASNFIQYNTQSNSSGYLLGLDTASTALIYFYKSGSQFVGSISTNGTTTAYNTSSDQRLKDNIEDAPSASADIDAIKVRSFDWKADGSHQKYGMVAQELVNVAPDSVSFSEDPDGMMGVDYSTLVPMLVKEIQQLRQRVAQLEE